MPDNPRRFISVYSDGYEAFTRLHDAMETLYNMKLSANQTIILLDKQLSEKPATK